MILVTEFSFEHARIRSLIGKKCIVCIVSENKNSI
jgi:hypothetical protein